VRCVVFFSNFCDVVVVVMAIHPYENLAKFGYKNNIKV